MRRREIGGRFGRRDLLRAGGGALTLGAVGMVSGCGSTSALKRNELEIRYLVNRFLLCGVATAALFGAVDFAQAQSLGLMDGKLLLSLAAGAMSSI